MHRRRVRYILDVLLLAAAVVVILTGLLVDQLDLNEFTPHRWAGYVAAVLIAVHVGLHWRWFIPSRCTDRQRREPGPSLPIDSAAEAGYPANLPFSDQPEAGAAAGAAESGGGAARLGQRMVRDAPTRRVGWPSRRSVRV